MLNENLILEKLANIEKLTLLSAKKALLIDDVALLTGLSKSSIYKMTCSHQIPFYKSDCRALAFDKSEIEEWMLKYKQSTIDETISNSMLRSK